ncbi:MAG TPA: CHAD domain-containing protein [Gemmataceae bacterium]|nr:CHAD domain-containing protein [Gemmataceae bacterium]
MAEGKWIRDLKPQTPVEEAARHVLFVRLQVVQEYLPRAALEAEDDIEYVHQLRVGTRRADAGLRIFADALPKKTYRKARKRLKRLRRAAGAARDWDVFLLALLEREHKADAKHRDGLLFLIGYALGQRSAAHADLQAVYQEEGPSFETFLVDTIEAIRPPDAESSPALLVDLARPILFDRLKELELAALADLRDYAQLHQVRIAGKRLRYAMEVFADCFDPAFRDTVYPRIEQLQDILGRANDSHVAAERLIDLRERLQRTCSMAWPHLQPGFEQLLRSHQRRLPQERKHFLKWWNQWHPAGSEAVMTSLLTPLS